MDPQHRVAAQNSKARPGGLSTPLVVFYQPRRRFVRALDSHSAQLLARPLHNALGVQRAGHARQFTAAAKQHQRRNTADTESSRQRLVLFGIHLEQPYRRFELGRGLLEGRRHHATRAPPGRPKIDQQRQITALRLFAERRRVHRHGLPGEQRRLAATTATARAQARHRHPIDPATLRAHHVFRRVQVTLHCTPRP